MFRFSVRLDTHKAIVVLVNTTNPDAAAAVVVVVAVYAKTFRKHLNELHVLCIV